MGRRWRRRRAKPSRPPCRSLLDVSDTRLKHTILQHDTARVVKSYFSRAPSAGAREEARVKTDREEGGLGQHPTMCLGTQTASILTILPLRPGQREHDRAWEGGHRCGFTEFSPSTPPTAPFATEFLPFGPSP